MQVGSATSYMTVGICAVAVTVMIALGNWQLNRMYEKQDRLESIAQKQQLGAVELSTLLSSIEDTRDYPVRFVANLYPEQMMFLDNRLHQGRAGYEVLVPVSTDSGWLLLNLGWVAAGNDRSELPAVTLPKGLTAFEGIVQLPQANVMVSETARVGDEFPLRVQQIDVPLLSSFIGKTLLPLVVQVTGPENPMFIRNWQPVVMPPEKHLAYAVQWFALAAAAFMIIAIVVFKEVTHDKRRFG